MGAARHQLAERHTLFYPPSAMRCLTKARGSIVGWACFAVSYLAQVAALASLESLAGCADRTVLSVQILARPGVQDTSELRVVYKSPIDPPWEHTFIPEDNALLFSGEKRAEVINIVADGRSGPVTIAVEAINREGQIVGRGVSETAVRKGQNTEALLSVNPADFRVNARKATSLDVSPTSAGRQLSSSAERGRPGVIAATWRQCNDENCQIVVRAYGQDAKPLKSWSGNTEEIFVTESTSSALGSVMPAIAVHARGDFGVVYKQEGPTNGIFSRTYRVQQGKIDPVLDEPTLLSSAEATDSSTPDISAMDNATSAASYIAAWVEQRSDGLSVRAMPLDERGLPDNEEGISNQPIEVDAIVTEGTIVDHVRPAVCGGAKGTFMVAWIDGGQVRAKLFDRNGHALTASALLPDTSGNNQVEVVDIAPLPGGYLLVWDNKLDAEKQENSRGIQTRRYDVQGKELDNNEATLTTGLTDQRNPAVTADPNGYALVVWTARSAGSQPTLRAQLLFPNGMPFGESFTVPLEFATMAQAPSVTAVQGDGYLMTLLNPAGNETTEGGVSVKRDQIVAVWQYPSRDTSEGQIGHRCDATHPCKSLVCAPVRGLDTRCVIQCREAGDTCVLGGRCLPLEDDPTQRFCLYEF